MGKAVGTVGTEGVLEAKPGFVGVARAAWKAGLRSDLRSAFFNISPLSICLETQSIM